MFFKLIGMPERVPLAIRAFWERKYLTWTLGTISCVKKGFNLRGKEGHVATAHFAEYASQVSFNSMRPNTEESSLPGAPQPERITLELGEPRVREEDLEELTTQAH